MWSQKLFDKYLRGRHWEKHPTIYAKYFANFLDDKKFQGLLVDIGCGSGRDVNVFNKRKFNVKGIDYSKKEILLAQNNFPHCNFEIQNAEKLDFANDSVGALYMINVIHYTDKEKVMSEFFRVLRQCGYIFIHFNLEIKDEDDNIDYKQNEEEVLNLISKFKIIEKNILNRADTTPKVHTHKIMELILQKE